MPSLQPVAFAWQLMPASPNMKHVRRTGRGLKRWGTRKGIKPGTTAGDEARIMAARWIHHYTMPHTKRPDVNFNDDLGEPFDDGDALAMAPAPNRAFNPYTLASIAALCETAFINLQNTGENESLWRPVTVGPLNSVCRLVGQRDGVTWLSNVAFCLALYRAIVTLLTAYTPTQAAEDAFFWVADNLHGSRTYLDPIKGGAAQIRYQPPNEGGNVGAWANLPFAEKWLC